MIKHVDREHLEITVLEIATVSTNHVILKTVHVLWVDVNVGMMELAVIQNVPVVTMAMIVNIIAGYALMVLVKDMKDFVQMDALTG